MSHSEESESERRITRSLAVSLTNMKLASPNNSTTVTAGESTTRKYKRKQKDVKGKKPEGVEGSPEKQKKVEKETNDMGEQFNDETVAVVADSLESFFLQGTTIKLNKKLRSKKTRVKLQPTSLDEQVEEQENLPECDLIALREFIAQEENSEVYKDRLELYTKQFPRWSVYLAEGFNLLMHGIGSKRHVMAQFCDSLSNFFTMQIDGSHPTAGAKALLGAINDAMSLNTPCNRRSSIEWATAIVKQLETGRRQLLLFVHNIDAENFRALAVQSTFSILGASHSIRIVASVNHINAMTIWNTSHLSSLRWIPIEVDTWTVSLKDIESSDSTFLGFDSKNSKMKHTLTSLDIFWKSLAANSRSIFRLLFSMHFAAGQTNPVPFWDLFNAAKDEFLVSTDTALRTQLVEFKDHCIIRMTRSEDGSDILHGALDRSLVEAFLTEKGLSLHLHV